MESRTAVNDYIDLMAGVPQKAADLLQCTSRQPWADFVAKVPEERPGQGNSTIKESELSIL